MCDMLTTVAYGLGISWQWEQLVDGRRESDQVY